MAGESLQMTSKRLDPQAAFALAVKSYGEGKLADALQRMNALIAANPGGAPRWFAVLASIHLKMDNKESAADAFVREARINPAMAGECLKHAASLYNAVTRLDRLADIAELAIEKNPGDIRTISLAIHALSSSRRDEAAARYMHLLDMRDPWQVKIAYFYHLRQKNREKCLEVLTQGVRATPTDVQLAGLRFVEARHLLDFEALRELDTIMQEPDSAMAKGLLASERSLNRLAWSTSDRLNAAPSQDSADLAELAAKLPAMPRRSIAPAGRRLRIGYLSNDFYHHAVMSVLEGVLARHDREKYDIRLFCYTSPDLRMTQDHWPDVLKQDLVTVHGLSSPEIVQAISDQQVDILVDLKGYTEGNRLEIVAASDAPVKVGYLGYPSTVANADLDYAITDHHITPDSTKPFYHEKLCRLPGSMMPNRPLADMAPQPTHRSDWGLPEDRFVFCSFNALFKISARTISLWSRILSAVPGSILWMRCDPPLARANLLAELGKNGIGPERVLFAEPVPGLADHITRLSLADLALDPTPYNGHVTTTDMLRAGLPVLAVRGTTSTSRMTEGQLSILGLEELVADDEDDYVARAVALANDGQALAGIRKRLLENRETSALFDTERYTRHLERAFEIIAERAREGLAPEHIDAPELPHHR